MKEKIFNTIIATALITYAITAVLTSIIKDVNIFFKGWWTLIFILPAIGMLFFQRNKKSSLFLILVGVIILLGVYKVLTVNKCFIILLSLVIIFIGINIIQVTFRIPKKRNSTEKYLPNYYAIFGSADEKNSTKFSGGYVHAIFGQVILDLTDSKIEDGSTIKLLNIFGSSELLLPRNIEILSSSKSTLGSSENYKNNKSRGRKNKLYIESVNILGGTKVK